MKRRNKTKRKKSEASVLNDYGEPRDESEIWFDLNAVKGR